MEFIHAADSLTDVLTFLGGLIFFFLLRPLNGAIKELRDAIKELRADLRTSEERRHMIEIQLAEVDQRARVAHRRLDEHIRIMHKVKDGGANDDVEHR